MRKKNYKKMQTLPKRAVTDSTLVRLFGAVYRLTLIVNCL